MKNNKIYTYGCSFSYPFWIEENETYTHILSELLECDHINKSFPALCHNETYHRLLSDIDEFKKNDLIVYQFTSGNREGFMMDNHSFYYSSAGIANTIEETVETMNKWGGGRSKYPMTDEQIMSIMGYINDWGEHTLFYKYNRVNKLLTHLEKTIGIKFVYLFLDSNFHSFIDNNTILFPDGNSTTPSILKWVSDNKLALSDYRNDVHPLDKHPNHFAHKIIGGKIFEHLKEKNWI